MIATAAAAQPTTVVPSVASGKTPTNNGRRCQDCAKQITSKSKMYIEVTI